MYELKLENYWNDLPTNRADAASYDDLRMWWGLPNDRDVRHILHELSRFDNGDDFVLIRSGKCKGFYKTDDKDEIKAYKQECLNKGRSVFAPVRKINRILHANDTQFSLENNLRVIREERQLTQSTVVEYMRAFDEHFDTPMLSKMENGFCLPTPYQLARLSELYGCDPSSLIAVDLFA